MGRAGWSSRLTTIASWVLRATIISTGSVSLAFSSQCTTFGGMNTKSPGRASRGWSRLSPTHQRPTPRST
jgi:hypothetical protein